LNKTDKVIVDVIDKSDNEAERPIEEETASIDKFSVEALAFWREYLRQPKERKAKAYRSRTSDN